MPPKNHANRTVQYWRLVDGRDESHQPEVNWHRLIATELYGKRKSYVVEGRELAGSVTSLKINSDWTDAFSLNDVPGGCILPDPTTTYGITIAAGKDFVPNQANRSNGDQKAMSLDNANWDPVDNLFVTFLPFGNMIAVLAESTSSSRAAKFADWITRATRSSISDSEFVWKAIPVIDPERAQLLKSAAGLRSATVAGEIGLNVADAGGLRSIFAGPKNQDDVTQIRIEVKASVMRGKSSHEDEVRILDWYTDTFGSLTGTVDKAQVTLSGTAISEPTEIDLLHHRITRKADVRLATGATRAFTAMSAATAMLNAFVIDRADLLRLRGTA